MKTAAPGSFESSFISGHPSKYTVTSDCACLEKPKKNPENSTSEKEVCLVYVLRGKHQSLLRFSSDDVIAEFPH